MTVVVGRVTGRGKSQALLSFPRAVASVPAEKNERHGRTGRASGEKRFKGKYCGENSLPSSLSFIWESQQRR